MKKHSDKHDIEKLLEIMATLRDPAGGCPWDREQTFATIAPYTIEEAYEVADAIERGALDELEGELGDLLFQVVFHARMAEELGRFDFGDVVHGICDKLLRRHPHVFGGARVEGVAEQSRVWEEIKRSERGAAGETRVLADVPAGLPGLSRAAKLGKRAATVGFDWPDVAGVRAKLREELAELDEALAAHRAVAPVAPVAAAPSAAAARLAAASDSAQLAAASDSVQIAAASESAQITVGAMPAPDAVAAEVGDLLFTVANLCRHLGLDPEACVRGANARFEKRFDYVEAQVRHGGGDWSKHDAATLDRLWEQAKSATG
jgi:ATP diphosphatase